MLPYKKSTGRDAFKRLKVWIGVPEEFKNKDFVRIEEADVNKLRTKHITIGDLCVYLGAKKRW